MIPHSVTVSSNYFFVCFEFAPSSGDILHIVPWSLESSSIKKSTQKYSFICPRLLYKHKWLYYGNNKMFLFSVKYYCLFALRTFIFVPKIDDLSKYFVIRHMYKECLCMTRWHLTWNGIRLIQEYTGIPPKCLVTVLPWQPERAFPSHIILCARSVSTGGLMSMCYA